MNRKSDLKEDRASVETGKNKKTRGKFAKT